MSARLGTYGAGSFRIADIPASSEWVLGFNEPDNSKQANIPVQQALEAWPEPVSRAKFLGAPAMAKNPLKSGGWLPAFMESSPKVDFITVHWMEDSACVQRYAWHDSKVGTSALFADGKLTATGHAYAHAGTQP